MYVADSAAATMKQIFDNSEEKPFTIRVGGKRNGKSQQLLKRRRYSRFVSLNGKVHFKDGRQRMSTIYQDGSIRVHSLAEERVYQSSLNKMGYESPEEIVSSLQFQMGMLNQPEGLLA